MKYIPTFKQFINESFHDKNGKPIGVDGQHRPISRVDEAEKLTQEHLEQVKNALPELEKLILKHSKVKTKLNADSGRNGSIKITSDDLSNQLSHLGKTVFTIIKVDFWGGLLTKEGTIWFNPKLEYEHPSGGSNGVDFIWDAISYNPETSKWIEGRRF